MYSWSEDLDDWIYTTAPEGHAARTPRYVFALSKLLRDHTLHCATLKLSIPPVDRPLARFTHP